MLRWLKTVVVSDEEKARVMRQVGARKTIIVEVSKSVVGIKTGVFSRSRDELGGGRLIGQAVSGMEMT